MPCSLLRSCWLPRGAMDLNQAARRHRRHRLCWLPRGAMDLNCSRIRINKKDARLAPSWSHGSKYRMRQPLQLCCQLAPSWSHGSKSFTTGAHVPIRRLAPSWSHGSKLKDDPTKVVQIRWLPRGAMDLNQSPVFQFPVLQSLAPSWSHGSK